MNAVSLNWLELSCCTTTNYATIWKTSKGRQQKRMGGERERDRDRWGGETVATAVKRKYPAVAAETIDGSRLVIITRKPCRAYAELLFRRNGIVGSRPNASDEVGQLVWWSPTVCKTYNECAIIAPEGAVLTLAISFPFPPREILP
jgi:hypothetical protein